MNDEELRRRMAALFEEYGGPLRPFVEAVHAWAESVDFSSTLPESGDLPNLATLYKQAEGQP